MSKNPMSKLIPLNDERLRQYILEKNVYPRENAALKEIRDVTAAHPGALMLTSPDSGQLMSMLLKIANAKRTIEIGVFTGYSLLLTALALPHDGQITAIDRNRETYNMGLPIIKKAGVEHKINYIQSEALPALDNLLQHEANKGSFDFAYVDADKVNYKIYHERLLTLVKVGGLILYDNTLWGGTVAAPEEEVPEDRRVSRKHTIEFNDAIIADPRIELSFTCTGDGLTICRRVA